MRQQIYHGCKGCVEYVQTLEFMLIVDENKTRLSLQRIGKWLINCYSIYMVLGIRFQLHAELDAFMGVVLSL